MNHPQTDTTVPAALVSALVEARVPATTALILIDDLDLAKFTNADGTPDADAIGALASRTAGNVRTIPAPVNLYQGRQGSPAPDQLTRADLARMDADQITHARATGRLRDLLEGHGA